MPASHINPVLDRLQNANLGTKIGTVCCGFTVCVDDLTLQDSLLVKRRNDNHSPGLDSKKNCDGQTTAGVVSETHDFSSMEIMNCNLSKASV